MAESIEEEWKKIGSQLGWNWNDAGASASSRRSRERKCIRAAFLVILDESTDHLSFAPDEEHGQRYEGLRKRIEALGR